MIRLRRSMAPYFWPVTAAAVVFLVLFAVGGATYLLFHSLAEIFAIVISFAAFTLVWNSRRFLDNSYLLIVGVTLLAASALNILHVLTYSGMGVLPAAPPDLPTQLWIARRYLESFALLVAPFFMLRRVPSRGVLAIFAGVTVLLLAAIFLHVFPTAYVEGAGLTSFKKVSEYVIAGLFLLAAYHLYRRRDRFGADTWLALVWALVVSAGAELLFTLYLGVYDLPNRIGHFLTIVAYYLIYLAIVKTGIERPYALLSASNAALRAEAQEREQAQAALLRQSQWLKSLHDIDRAILSSRSTREIAAATAALLVDATAARWVAILLCDREEARLTLLAAHGAGPDLPAELPWHAYWFHEENCRQRIGMIPDARALPPGDARREGLLAAGIGSAAGVPLVVGGQSIGAIVLGQVEPGPLSAELLDSVTQVAAQLAVAIRQAQLFDELSTSRRQLRAMSHRLVALQEEERKRLSRELHDRAGQSMTALLLGLGIVQRRLEDQPDLQADVAQLHAMTDGVMEELHELAVTLRPVSLDRYGLVAALEQHVASFRKQYPLEVDFVANGLEGTRLPEDVETALYRIVQESLTNVSRHAQAERVRVALTRAGANVTLVIEDNGRGFDVEEALRQGRLGLLGMRERAEMLGGTAAIHSTPGQGTRIRVQLPVGG